MLNRFISCSARVIGSLFAVALVVLVAISIVPRFFGYTPYAVLSGSMEPELPVGSMVFVHDVDPSALQEGDNVTFYRSDGAVVTHQIFEIDQEAKEIGTQGIANKKSDGSIAHDAQKTAFSQIIGVPILCIPYLGYVNAYCTTPPGLYIVVVLAALLLIASVLLDRCEPRSRKHMPVGMQGRVGRH